MSLAVSAKMYRWVDSAGTVHFAAQPPAHGQYRAINPQPPPPTSAPAQAALTQYSKDYEAERAKQRQAHEAQLKLKARRAALCAKARQRIAALQAATAHRLYITLSDGSRRRMTQPEFQQHVDKAKAVASQNCAD